MNTQLFLTTVLAAICLSWAASAKDEATAFKDAVFEKCKKEESIPENVAQDFYDLKSVEGLKNHKCFVKCVNMEYKIMRIDGTMDEEKIAEAIKGQWKKPENYEKLIPVAKDCLEKVNKDTELCEYNYNVCHCFIEGLKKVQIAEE